MAMTMSYVHTSPSLGEGKEFDLPSSSTATSVPDGTDMASKYACVSLA